MTKPMPDTDPLKREPPGAVSKVPDSDGTEQAQRPPNQPEDDPLAETGDKHRPIQPRGDEPLSR